MMPLLVSLQKERIVGNIISEILEKRLDLCSVRFLKVSL